MSVEFKNHANLVMFLHAVKYHNFDTLGVLVGHKAGNKVVVETAIPLFH